MPVTRSQRGPPRRAPTEEEATETTEASEGTRTMPTSTDSMATTGTTCTTGTALQRPAATGPKEKEVGRKEQATAGKSSARSKSVTPSLAAERARKRREVDLRAELIRQELQEAQAAAALARVELERLRMQEEDEADTDSADEEPEDRAEDVQEWVKDTVIRMSTGGHRGEGGTSAEGRPVEALRKGYLGKPQDPTATVPKPEERTSANKVTEASGVDTLADAIVKAIGAASRSGHAQQPAYMVELPIFDGCSGEWLAFRTVYEDTALLFSDVQNMARLRKALKGAARESVRSILYSECTPRKVMDSLRCRFGRPDALVLAELERIKGLPRTTENARDVCVFANAISNTVATINGLKKPHYLNSPEMIKVIIDKLPTVLKYRWYDFAADHEDPDLSLISQFLDREAERCGPYASQEVTKKVTRQATHTATEPREAQPTPCAYCEGSHSLDDCKQFREAALAERWTIARKSGLCFKCLRGRHRKETCRKPPCKACRRWHHQLLHDDRRQQDQEPKDQGGSNVRKEVANNVRLEERANATKGARAYLKMVPVEVYGPRGKAQVLALLDEGSTVTLLDAEVAKNIGLQGPKEALSIETVGGRVINKDDSMRVDMKVRGLHQGKQRKIVGARTIDALRLTPQRIDKSRLEECTHLQKLMSRLHYEEESPRLLIGQDNWELIVSRATRKGKHSQPAASLTHLGWVLHGLDGGAAGRTSYLTCAHVSERDGEMDELIKRHFAIESLGVQPRRPSTDAEERAVQIMKKSTRRLEDGRFETGLLWKNEQEVMPDNYESALNRLRNIERKLDKDSGLKSEYHRQVENLFTSGYAEEVAHESSSKRKWYLPHFAVTHPTKKKKRLVFDAAAKYKGKSLNDALLSGPDLLQSLFGVLLRFRQRPVGVVSDIKEMFLQVRIRAEDRDSLRFLWRGEKRGGAPREFRMTSVIFGAACSPSLAIYAKNRNAEEFQSEYPAAAEAIVRNHYMDDYLHCFNDEEEALQVSREVDAIHQRAGFRLRGWASNKERVRKELSEEETAEVELGSKEEKTLGLRWFTEKDEMGFRTHLRNVEEIVTLEKTPTKRQVTSAVMSTFDPLGLASPVLIQGKKLIQDIWRSGVGWDEEVTPADESSWKAYLQNLHLLDDLRVPRCVSRVNVEGEMHVFTDASEAAYACVVYWRQKIHEGLFQVSLLAGKARVTPLKPVSIPRLELQAALLGARLAHSIEEEMDLKAVSKTYWTDSSTVLSWIRADPRNFKPFVAHRLAELEDTTKPQHWRWVPTAHNPADDATRGIPRNFDEGHRWYTGPKFLRGEEREWPEARSFKHERTGEEKELQVTAAARVREYATPDPQRFSKWTRLLRATARVLQFTDLCRKRDKTSVAREQDPTWRRIPKKKVRAYKRPEKVETGRKFLPLDAAYLRKAEQMLLRRSQDESGLEDSGKLKRLDIVKVDGLLRLRGRVDALEGMEELKRPVILDSKSWTVRLLIAHFHEEFNHGNHQTVINEIRQRYWIVGLRSAVRATRHGCQWCRVYRNEPQRLPTGDLPKERLRVGEPPFSNTAIDYFGPMTVTVGRRHEKRWGALFTCLTTRAVHLELAANLSSDSMILALRRMAARRGMPKTIFSDNGTNFVGANKELQEAIRGLNHEALVEEAESRGVRWKFIAPGAPNMGGAWERLVRSVKTALAVTLNERHPQEEVLHTLLLEAEHVVNSRPLITADTEEEGLTPNHFLIGRSCGIPRLGVFTEEDLSGRRSWRTAQRLADHFWARWVREYLPTLVPRKSGGMTTERDLQCGDTVLIVDPTLPRNCWPRGVVVQTYPGPDGRTRVIDVRTPHGALKRPCSKAVLLVPGGASEPTSNGRRDSEMAGMTEQQHHATTSDGQSCVADAGVGAAHEGEDVGDGIRIS